MRDKEYILCYIYLSDQLNSHFCTTPDWSGDVFIRESGVQFQEINDFHLLLIILVCIQKGPVSGQSCHKESVNPTNSVISTLYFWQSLEIGDSSMFA
jgi:hypothetical protein